MGRHAAGDGAGVDPIVEAALAQRPAPVEDGAPRHGADRAQLSAATDGEGALGWPGEPGEGGRGLGWPVDQLDRADAAPQQSAGTPAVEPPARRRPGWRRLFGGRDEAARSSNAA